MTEIPLDGGNVSGGVVRIGDTARRPAAPWTPAVHALLGHLHAAGFHGATPIGPRRIRPRTHHLHPRHHRLARQLHPAHTVESGSGNRAVQPGNLPSGSADGRTGQ